VKLALFAVFVLTLQTDFAARWFFWFSADDFFIEQVCPSPLAYAVRTLRNKIVWNHV